MAYLDNKTYILLSGENHSECLNYDDNTVKIYKSKNNKQDLIVNFFKKDNNIYLISGDIEGKVYNFDFSFTDLIKKIKIKEGEISSLCVINEKNLILS